MDTSRIIINTIDNSTSNVEQSTATVGFTVVKAPKGSITPRKILAGGASKLKDIFGVSTDEYPELFEVETFNKEYDIYVSAPYKKASVPVAYLTDTGVFVSTENVDYNDKLEALILEGDTYESIDMVSAFSKDPEVYKKCEIKYESISTSSSREAGGVTTTTTTKGLMINTGIKGSDINKDKGNFIKIKGLLSSLNSNYLLKQNSLSVVDEKGSSINNDNANVTLNAYKKEGTTFTSVSSNDIGTIVGDVYIFVSDKKGSNLIQNTYNVSSNFKELSAYVKTSLDKNKIHATILPKYPSDRKLHISLTPYNDNLGYSYKVLSQRNIIKLKAYEDGAFHNANSPVYIEGTLDKSNSSIATFTNSNDSVANQELVCIVPIKSFTKESIAIEPHYDSIVLEGGTREFKVKESKPENNKSGKDAKETSTEGTTTQEPTIQKPFTSIDLHNLGWETIEKGDFDDVDIFFDSVIHDSTEDFENSKFFELGISGPQNNKFSGHIFNYTPTDLTNLERLTLGRNYWNICNLAVIDLPNGYRIMSPMTGARALMQCRIIENAMGGVAPMWENSRGMGGQLNMITPYRVKNKYTKSELDTLDMCNFNPVIYDRQYGLMCVGQKTCKDEDITDWSYIGHACSFMVFIKQIRKNVMFPQIGKKNNPYYRTLRKEQVQQYLRERISGTNRIWSEGIVDTSTADGVNDINAQRNRCFRILVKVKVDTFSEYVELNFYNEDQATTIGTDF